MKHFFKDTQGKLSSKRLLFVLTGIPGILLIIFGGLAPYLKDVEHPLVPILAGSTLLAFAMVLSGMATFENIKSVINAVRGNDVCI